MGCENKHIPISSDILGKTDSFVASNNEAIRLNHEKLLELKTRVAEAKESAKIRSASRENGTDGTY